MSDLMTRAVVQMPYELAMLTELSRRQFYDCAQQVLAERDAAMADARRYRWMRVNPLTMGDGTYLVWKPEGLDAAIDAAMKESGNETA